MAFLGRFVDNIGEVHRHKRRSTTHKLGHPSLLDRMRRLEYPMSLIVSLLALCTGLAALAKGRQSYHNYYGLTVYAPFAIFIGFGGLCAALLRRRKNVRR